MSSQESSKTKLPYGRVTLWRALFELNYLFRVVSFDIWWSSRRCGVDFEELKFGETPLDTVRQILDHCQLTPDSTIYDLGCGRGKAAFYFHFLTGAQVIGIDLVGSFILTGRRLARWLKLDHKILFCYEDIRESHLKGADLVYTCAACMSGETRAILADKIAACRPGTIHASVGWKPEHTLLKVVHHETTRFSWGKANLYISQVVEDTI